jgi:RNA polymerase sigma-70 factor (ECF subfamily)
MTKQPEHDAILSCYDDLLRLALSKCNHQQDAEDLVSETMLAAYAYLHRGGVIHYPRTWLANTLMHKYNSALRKKYASPVSVSPDALLSMSDDSEALAEEAFLATEEAARLRRELCYLGELHRKVLLRHYFYGESVAEIAEALGVPQGTVKSRLSAGRDALRVRMTKGMEENMNMESKKNPIPGRLWVNWSGNDGPGGEPTSLVEGDLIAENLRRISRNGLKEE